MEAVRTAVTGDEDRVAELVRAAVDGMRGERGAGLLLAGPGHGGAAVPGSGRVAELLDEPGRTVLVGTLDGVVTGTAIGHVAVLPDGTRIGHLDCCYVEPDARGVGLGHLLVDAAVSWFAGQGCAGVDGLALPGDREAKNFFEAAGFKARLLTMHRPVT